MTFLGVEYERGPTNLFLKQEYCSVVTCFLPKKRKRKDESLMTNLNDHIFTVYFASSLFPYMCKLCIIFKDDCCGCTSCVISVKLYFDEILFFWSNKPHVFNIYNSPFLITYYSFFRV